MPCNKEKCLRKQKPEYGLMISARDAAEVVTSVFASFARFMVATIEKEGKKLKSTECTNTPYFGHLDADRT